MKKVTITVQDDDLSTVISSLAHLMTSITVEPVHAGYVGPDEGPYVDPSNPIVRAKVRRARTQHIKRQQNSAPSPVTQPNTRRDAIMRLLRAQNGASVSTEPVYTLAKQHGDHAKHWLNILNTLRKRGTVVREYPDGLTPHYRLSARGKRRAPDTVDDTATDGDTK